MTNKILWLGIVIVTVIILMVIISFSNFTLFEVDNNSQPSEMGQAEFVEEQENRTDQTEAEEEKDAEEKTRPDVEVVGQSAGGHDINAYTFGDGEGEILLVAGIHGGYSWNTSQLAFELIDYLEDIKDDLADVRVTVIPVLNPDGLDTIFGTTGELSSALTTNIPSNTVPGRFNGNNVDLNRNFDCQWQESGVWRNQTVSGGSSAFSEPESQAIRSYVEKYRPTAVIAYYSAAGGVYASNCNNGVSSATRALLQDYGTASEYPMYESYDYYATTGDMANWFAKENIPAISVLLTNHTDIELTKNKAGLSAVINR